jgi:hypothetical protein
VKALPEKLVKGYLNPDRAGHSFRRVIFYLKPLFQFKTLIPDTGNGRHSCLSEALPEKLVKGYLNPDSAGYSFRPGIFILNLYFSSSL